VLASTMSARHLYVHLPFCSSRCGYCDFVTVVGRVDEHDAYVDALLAELDLERHLLDGRPETIFLGGGTPSFTRPEALDRLLAALPPCDELTVEANPETVTVDLAERLRRGGVDRVSLGVQSFTPELLATLDRAAGPDDARRAIRLLRAAGFDNLSIDLIYGIPGQSRDDLARDLREALALEPEHVSAYELEAKPGTRFTRAHGEELERQAEAMESYFELVVETLTQAGYRWYETANFCRGDRRARHNLGYWLGHDYLGIGVGAVSTIDGRRIRNLPSLRRYLASLQRGARPPREVEDLSGDVRAAERVLLGLRLDEPLDVTGLEAALDRGELERLTALGLVDRDGSSLALTPRGRFLGGGVTGRLLA
jgi:putative oxygen-independent coproporphyrinogen III oxidase